jgi:hypothetical protein
MKVFGRLLVVLLAVLEVEALVFLLFDFNAGPFWRVFLPLAAHCLAVALLAIGFTRPWDYSKAADRAWAVTGMCLTLPVPLLGFLGFVTVYALATSGPRGRGDLLRDFQEYIAYDPALSEMARRGEDEDRFILGEVDVAPLRDILSGQDVALKRGAILSLSRLPRPEAVTLLKTALADPSREIRYYASTALSDMEKEFNDRIFRLIREVERSPTAIDRHIDLARIVLEYAEAGLLDEGMARYFLDVGLRALDKAVLVAAKDRRIDLLSARLHRRAGNLTAADEAIRRYVGAMPDDVEGALLAAEIAFEHRDTARARAVVAEAAARFPEEKRLAELRAVMELGA